MGFVFNDKSNSFSSPIITEICNIRLSGTIKVHVLTKARIVPLYVSCSCQVFGLFAFIKQLKEPDFNLSPLLLLTAAADMKISLILSPPQ